MKSLISHLYSIRRLLSEGLVIFLLIFSVNNYLGKPEDAIRSDGVGYYEYLPSIFIYNDIDRKDLESIPDRIGEFTVYVQYDDHLLNKYPGGTAFLLTPFFGLGHYMALQNDEPLDGYSSPYQKAMYYAGLFYLFLGLFFLRKFLELYDIKWQWILFMQIITVFTTSIMAYISLEPTYSHIYSFFAINAFLFFTTRYFKQKSQRDFLWACAFLGLIIFIRQINVLIILAIPFLAGSVEQFTEGVRTVWNEKRILILGIMFSGLFILAQMILWYLQTGHFVVYSYQGEGFNFASPNYLNILFSYQKGLYVYTPIALLALIGVAVWIKKKNYYLWISWLGFFVILTYVLSSWWAWAYGSCYGNRAYIDYYALILFPITTVLTTVPKWPRLMYVVICIGLIPISMIQTFQYKNFIMHWHSMNEHRFWEIFLRQGDQLNGIYFKKEYKFGTEEMVCIDSLALPNSSYKPNEHRKVFSISSSEIERYNEMDLIQVCFDAQFDYEQKSSLTLAIVDSATNESYYYHQIPLLLYKEDDLGTYHRGEYNYELPPIPSSPDHLIDLDIMTDDRDVQLKKVKIRFYTMKK